MAGSVDEGEARAGDRGRDLLRAGQDGVLGAGDDEGRARRSRPAGRGAAPSHPAPRTRERRPGPAARASGGSRPGARGRRAAARPRPRGPARPPSAATKASIPSRRRRARARSASAAARAAARRPGRRCPPRATLEDEPADGLGVGDGEAQRDPGTHRVADHVHRGAPRLRSDRRQVVRRALDRRRGPSRVPPWPGRSGDDGPDAARRARRCRSTRGRSP